MNYGGVAVAVAVYLGVAAEARATDGLPCPKSEAEVQQAGHKWRLGEAYADSGVGPVQIRALSKVACAMGEVIALRPVNKAAGPWILDGAPTKDMSVKPKSATDPLIQGLIPTQQMYSKGGDPYNKYVDKALLGKDITDKHNVTQVEVERDMGGGKKGLVCSRGGTKLEVADPGPEQREVLRVKLAELRKSASEAALRDFKIDGNCVVVTVLALDSGGVPKPMTADYDIFFLMSRAGVSRGARHESPNGALERRFGFTDDRDLGLITCMNRTLKDDLNAAAKPKRSYVFDLVHHGPDTTNPAKDDIDDRPKSYFPALVLQGCRAPVLVQNKGALQTLLLDLQRDNYVVPQAFTRAKTDGGYGLELKSSLDPAIVVGAAIRMRPRASGPCEDAEVTAVSHADKKVTLRWVASGRHRKFSFEAVNAGCPADDPGSNSGDEPPPPDKPKDTAFKFKVKQKLWLMYDFPTADGGPKKCEWAEVTAAEAAAADGAPWYSIRWVAHSWDDWSKPETKIVEWQQHCLK